MSAACVAPSQTLGHDGAAEVRLALNSSDWRTNGHHEQLSVFETRFCIGNSIGETPGHCPCYWDFHGIACGTFTEVSICLRSPSGNVKHEIQRRPLLNVPRKNKTKGNRKKKNYIPKPNSL